MKMRKGISAVLAGVMALAALPVSAMSASAEGAYALGDVDMDGYITGHDAAMVTRALYVDNEALTVEQLRLADVNGDGIVDQSDADWIHENQVYELGQLEKEFPMNATTVFFQSYYIAKTGAGTAYPLEKGVDLSNCNDYDNVMPEVCYNLLDVNGDGTLDNDDLFITLFDVSYMGAAIKKTIYFEENRYDLSVDSIRTWCDADTSGKVAADWNDIHNSINYK
ncbi:dockerin type I repeat-containing protein [Ruminococcus sp.]